MTPEAFTDLIAPIARRAACRPLDRALEDDLNRTVPPDSAAFREIKFHRNASCVTVFHGIRHRLSRNAGERRLDGRIE